MLALRQDGNAAELRLDGAAETLAQDADLRFLLGEGGENEPGLRALLMREVLQGNEIELRRAGDGAIALRFSNQVR